ncbi:SRPBCC family protein [Candidatus Palauibacter polyketidifaciens]|uniref:SRPBCC family protein n=1 Tax=Candidatus Palauibacter polyketidifaciens TaxID=3056740 RepID=UPI0023A2480D|nr:SRPBCC family protein [Candidatus Palauibacter polyketidifaciens]MDE2721497.1 SRPBCC family protein [Candidatus Palauibacter polyketidifaciens]
MEPTKRSLTINASCGTVFRAVADLGHFSKAVPQIDRIEILSESTAGVGTRFRETRLVRGRETASELRVAELVENERVRYVSDTFGTRWNSTFTVAPAGDRTRLTMVIQGRPYRVLSRLAAPLMKFLTAKAVAADMKGIKAYAESLEESAASA